MEVHHHPHTQRSGEKRKFKEYFLEFLMLFLAVTLGFLAESLRERIVRNEKEEHFIKSLVQDIKKDITDLRDVMTTQNFILAKMDSALRIPVTRLRDINSQDTFFHHFFFFYAWTAEFHQNNNTYSQLVNAGGFSVIHKQEVIDSISLFNSFAQQQVIANGKYYLDYYDKIVQLATQLMDLPEMPPTVGDSLFTSIPHRVEFFSRYDLPLLKQLYSLIRYDKGTLVYYVSQEEEYRRNAERMIEYLDKTYNLKE